MVRSSLTVGKGLNFNDIDMTSHLYMTFLTLNSPVNLEVVQRTTWNKFVTIPFLTFSHPHIIYLYQKKVLSQTGCGTSFSGPDEVKKEVQEGFLTLIVPKKGFHAKFILGLFFGTNI